MINATEADLAPYCLGDDILAIIISFLQPLDMLKILSVNKQWRLAANSAASRLIDIRSILSDEEYISIRSTV